MRLQLLYVAFTHVGGPMISHKRLIKCKFFFFLRQRSKVRFSKMFLFLTQESDTDQMGECRKMQARLALYGIDVKPESLER